MPLAAPGTRPAGVGSLATRIARRIEAEVVERDWPVGASLGSEPELRARFGVSRSVFREAVRLVEHHQVARMRRGPNGGLFVMAPDAGPAAHAVVIYLEHVGTSVDDLIEARRLLEPLAAGLAAQRVDEDGIAVLRRTVEEEARDTGAGQPEALHVVLAELSANPVLRLFIDVLVRLTARYTGPFDLSRRRFQVAVAESRRFHAQIAEAVIAGDGGRAESRMGEYLDGTHTWMRVHGRRATTAAGTPLPAAADRDGASAKLAEVVAARLRADIVAAGRPPGAVVGTESELLERYGVSRAVLREAVRLLESHSVARMRRGPGGGLVVGAPDPAASIETMALHLQYLRVSAADLLPVRDALELGIVTRLAARSAEAGLRERLDRAVRSVQDGPAGVPHRAHPFHAELADLAGNPVLALFLRILTELWSRHTAAERDTADGDTADVELVHRRISDAVLSGDDGLARHRMRRHLAALPGWWH
jgi:DNA-binding FadR family transcriptional regulator